MLGFASFGWCRDGDAPAGRGELWSGASFALNAMIEAYQTRQRSR